MKPASLCRFLLTLALFATGLPAVAWGGYGHRVVASIADSQLGPAARRGVDALLALEPGATLASVSTWADEQRGLETAPWHFLNLPRNAACRYEPARDCPAGQCVVAAIETQTRRLASSAAPAERLEALKYVVHLLADVHQPLHVGWAEDRGGNRHQLQAFGRGTNLHALWDSGLLRQRTMPAEALAAELLSQTPPARLLEASRPADWARESCEIASAPGFHPGRELPVTYVDTYLPVVDARLLAAGWRLAGTLNRAFEAMPP